MVLRRSEQTHLMMCKHSALARAFSLNKHRLLNIFFFLRLVATTYYAKVQTTHLYFHLQNRLLLLITKNFLTYTFKLFL